ncbi:MAG: AAA family ATPase, partial [Gammaproteobacteria bacterium]
MRLKQIKLVGFKSFVDQTTVPFKSNLTAIVGPNGCGKSNIIDAVRWVMGESSAKHLRGESMSDVIFSGSDTRKPVGQASIELIFDNSDGTISGEYAGYNELAIKRLVTREGQSQYFLNGNHCRKKDITHIFLGTGLGPRSYAIIEQGIISRLIEAKPDELRVYIEEAAGVSKYKERRKETERRIRHTRDNLDRLNDIREELGRQLAHLQRQAKAAERYKTHKAEERQRKAELLALRWQDYNNQLEGYNAQLQDSEVHLSA